MDDEPAFDPAATEVAAAQALLEVARRSGNGGSIARAQFNLALTLAAVGDHHSAADQYAELISYLDLAGRDREAEERRWLRRTSPAAPPPGPDDLDPKWLQTYARIKRADSLLTVGNRAEAADELQRAAAAARGVGKGRLRKEINTLRRRMAAAADAGADGREGPGTGKASRHSSPPPAVSAQEQVAAADELLGSGHPSEAARVALQAIARCGQDGLPVRARARQVLGMALEAMGQTADATKVLSDSFADYLAAGETVPAAHIAVPLAWRLSHNGDTDRAIAVLRQALTVTESAGLPALRAQLFTDIGSLLDQTGRPDESRQAFETAAAIGRAQDDRELVANAEHGLAVVLALAGSADREPEVEALSLLDSCRSAYESLGQRDRVAGCEHESAALLGRLGSFEAARNRYSRALAAYLDLPEEDRDTGAWPNEVADVKRNIEALTDGRTDAPGLFRSGGHAMQHG